MNTKKLASIVLITISLINSFYSIASNNIDLNAVVNEYIRGNSKISYSSFEKINQEVSEDFQLYVIDITDDTQNYPSLGRYLPDDIKDIRKGLSGSKKNKEEIEQIYGNLLIGKDVFIERDDLTDKEYLLIFVENERSNSVFLNKNTIIILGILVFIVFVIIIKKAIKGGGKDNKGDLILKNFSSDDSLGAIVISPRVVIHLDKAPTCNLLENIYSVIREIKTNFENLESHSKLNLPKIRSEFELKDNFTKEEIELISKEDNLKDELKTCSKKIEELSGYQKTLEEYVSNQKIFKKEDLDCLRKLVISCQDKISKGNYLYRSISYTVDEVDYHLIEKHNKFFAKQVINTIDTFNKNFEIIFEILSKGEESSDLIIERINLAIDEIDRIQKILRDSFIDLRARRDESEKLDSLIMDINSQREEVIKAIKEKIKWLEKYEFKESFIDSYTRLEKVYAELGGLRD